jgi:hypothetical protein
MRSRRVRGGGALVALLAVVFAVVPAILRGRNPTSELDGPMRAVLVSLDTPAPEAEAPDVPTAGSRWALVDAPGPASGESSLAPILLQAIVDYVRALLGQSVPALDLPVQGVAGGGGLSVQFTGSATPGQTVALGPDGATGVVTISILTVTTTRPVAPPPGDPPTSTTTTTTAPGASDPVSVPATLHVAPQPLDGPRDPRLWPFDTNSPWNTPLGDGASFDTRPVVPGPFNVSAANGYGVSVGGAGYALVDQPRGEFHYSIYRPDGVTVDEYYRYGHAEQNQMVTDARGDGVGVGWDTATQLSQLGGLIRVSDLRQGVIPHALQLIMSAQILSSDAVWPAKSVDGYAASNTGFVPYGALIGIPKDAVMPDGLSPVGEMIWTALRDYGGYVADAQGAVGTPTESFTSVRAEAATDPMVAAIQPDLRKIGAQMRWVTNSTRDQLGGPGARLAPLAPDFSVAN